MAGLKTSLDQAADKSEAVEKAAAAAGEITKLQQQIKQMEEETGEGKAEYEKRIVELEERLSVEEKKVFDLEAERRKLQNQVQELRGNVRVFARLRPFLPNDKKRDDEESVITVGLDMTSMVLRVSSSVYGVILYG
jgi:kinesin family member C1